MVAVPTIEQEDAKRPSRERENLVGERTRIVNRMKSALTRLGIRGFKPQLRKAPQLGMHCAHLKILRFHRTHSPRSDATLPVWPFCVSRSRRLNRPVWSVWRTHRRARPNAMVRLLASVIGVGIETAYLLVLEVFSRDLRDRRAVARYAGLTGAPDESGSKRREKGLAKAGNARVRRGMIQLAWRFLLFQKDSALAQWFRSRTEGASGARKTKMIVALARKLLIALWRMVTTGEVPHGVVLRQAA